MNQMTISLHRSVERIYHPYGKWECYPCGFFDEAPAKGIDKANAESEYAKFLSDSDLFFSAALRVISEWKYSCEHNLTNESMNRIAWVGQASACIHLGLPSKYRAGFNLLSEEQKIEANSVALKAINIWLKENNYYQLSEESVQSKTVQNKY